MQILANFRPVVGPTSTPWQQHLKLAIRDVDELLSRLNLPGDPLRRIAEKAFETFVPLPYLSRIERGNLRDPLLLQVLPSNEEQRLHEGFGADPVSEHQGARSPGVIQKYAGRVLFILAGVCGVNCRYCFRRSFPYDEAPKSIASWGPGLNEISEDTSIHEVILSGGDPLMLVDETLRSLIDRIALIPHIRRLRIHTRLPVVIPQRVTEELCDSLTAFGRRVAVVLHVNHPREIDGEVERACSRLRDERNITLLNQSVLLRGVNDQVDVLTALSERLFECGVLPYYLHQLDRVAGAAHFEVPEVEGREIVKGLRRALPGYLVPRYVREVAGEPNKTILL